MKIIESKWKSWENIKTETKNPGVYVICVSNTNMVNKNIKTINPKIKYIGMTVSKNGLRQRLNQFNNVIKGKGGHGGADRFMNDFDKNIVKKMYYKTFEFDLSKIKPRSAEYYLILGEVLKFEYVLFSKSIEIAKELPIYNRPTSPKQSKKTKK